MKKMLLIGLVALGTAASLYAAEAPVSDRDAALALDEANQTMAVHDANATDVNTTEAAPAQ